MTGFDLGRFCNTDMVMFSSMDFIFLFLPIFLALYYIFPKRYRNAVLLLGSLVFYAIGSPFYIALLLAVIFVNYLGAKWTWNHTTGRLTLILMLVFDVSLLVLFKALHIWDNGILMPLGISFFIFKMISYQVDVYKGEVENPVFIKTAVYFVMFPQMVSGPIARYGQIQEALEKRTYSMEQFEKGLQLLVLGLAGKVLLADRLSLLWNDIQTIGFESISTPLAWLGAFAYSLELYFDFAGYSLMAGGICVMLGFPFIRNFEHPYASGSIREFFRRWHMTLGAWFRDYLYIPMGGSRCRAVRWVFNLFFVWLVTGLWHGGSLNFVIWGLTLFLLILGEKLIWGRWLERWPLLGHVYVIIMLPLTWMVFAIQKLPDMAVYFSRLFPFVQTGISVNPADFIKYIGNYGVVLIVAIVCCIPWVYKKYEKYKKSPVVTAGLLLLFWLSVYFMSNAVNNPFLYSDF